MAESPAVSFTTHNVIRASACRSSKPRGLPDPHCTGSQSHSRLMPLLEALLLRSCLDARTVEAAGASDEPTRPPLELLLRVYPELLDRIRGKRVLDFGCGPGTQSVAL